MTERFTARNFNPDRPVPIKIMFVVGAAFASSVLLLSCGEPFPASIPASLPTSPTSEPAATPIEEATLVGNPEFERVFGSDSLRAWRKREEAKGYTIKLMQYGIGEPQVVTGVVTSDTGVLGRDEPSIRAWAIRPSDLYYDRKFTYTLEIEVSRTPDFNAVWIVRTPKESDPVPFTLFSARIHPDENGMPQTLIIPETPNSPQRREVMWP